MNKFNHLYVLPIMYGYEEADLQSQCHKALFGIQEEKAVLSQLRTWMTWTRGPSQALQLWTFTKVITDTYDLI